MLMRYFARYQRSMVLFMLPFLLIILIWTPVSAQEKVQQETRGTNVKWSMQGDIILITYDLNAPIDNKYQVGVIMKNEKDESFQVLPLTTEGDIGDGILAGNDHQIKWYFIRDHPQEFQGEGYFFEIHVKPIESSNKLLYYAIGAGAVGGGLLLLLLSHNQSTTPPAIELPTPPARP